MFPAGTGAPLNLLISSHNAGQKGRMVPQQQKMPAHGIKLRSNHKVPSRIHTLVPGSTTCVLVSASLAWTGSLLQLAVMLLSPSRGCTHTNDIAYTTQMVHTHKNKKRWPTPLAPVPSCHDPYGSVIAVIGAFPRLGLNMGLPAPQHIHCFECLPKNAYLLLLAQPANKMSSCQFWATRWQHHAMKNSQVQVLLHKPQNSPMPVKWNKHTLGSSTCI
jgi:hypothetical protein